jgi:hypothetical protein
MIKKLTRNQERKSLGGVAYVDLGTPTQSDLCDQACDSFCPDKPAHANVTNYAYNQNQPQYRM